MVEKNKLVRSQRPEPLYIKDVNDCDDVKNLGNGNSIEYPYTITIVDSQEQVVFDEHTTNQIFTSDWNKKFYKTKKGRTGFNQESGLLAICRLMEQLEPEEFKSSFNTNGYFEINNIIGFSFKGVVVRLDDGRNFIDWVATFKENEIPVPNLDEGASDEEFDKQEDAKAAEAEEVDPSEVPDFN